MHPQTIYFLTDTSNLWELFVIGNNTFTTSSSAQFKLTSHAFDFSSRIQTWTTFSGCFRKAAESCWMWPYSLFVTFLWPIVAKKISIISIHVLNFCICPLNKAFCSQVLLMMPTQLVFSLFINNIWALCAISSDCNTAGRVFFFKCSCFLLKYPNSC